MITIKIAPLACLGTVIWSAVTTNGRYRISPPPMRKSGVARATACRTHSKTAAALQGTFHETESQRARSSVVSKNKAAVRLVS